MNLGGKLPVYMSTLINGIKHVAFKLTYLFDKIKKIALQNKLFGKPGEAPFD